MQLTEEKIIAFLKSSLQVEDGIGAGDELFSSGTLDSVAMLQVISFVEKETGAEVRADEVTLENFDTVAGILRFAAAKAAA